MELRSTTKAWKAVAEVIDEGAESGELLVHGGKDIRIGAAWAHSERRKLATRVVFLLNITKVGARACNMAAILVVVDIPNGIESIGDSAFSSCYSLTAVSFPTTLKSIGVLAFASCSSLENVDLLHTNLQELGQRAFWGCSELKSMMIPESLKMFGKDTFSNCSKLVSSSINVKDNNAVVAHLRLQQFLSGNNFLNTNDFHRLLVQFLPNDTLMTIRLASKPWSCVAGVFISDSVESGAIIVHDGKDISRVVADARRERRELVTRVIFLLNVMKVGDHACIFAANLVVVDIPEGVESIGVCAFSCCDSFTTVSFPITLTSSGRGAFNSCWSLENVDLLHTNLQKLGRGAFNFCPELKSMTILDSLQTLGVWVFSLCAKLVPSSINVRPHDVDGQRLPPMLPPKSSPTSVQNKKTGLL